MHIPGRRHFIKNAAILGPIFTLLPSYLSAGVGPRLRIAFIGAGAWGQQYLSHALQHKDLDVRAICDNDPMAIHESLQLFGRAGYVRPDVYQDSYKPLLARKDIDVIIIAAPWHQHYDIAKAAMLAGKHVACGTVMGVTLAEHWDIVRISEKTGCHYFTLDENSHRRDLMAISNMVDKGVFGTLETVHAGTGKDILTDIDVTAPLPYPIYPGAAVAKMLGIQKGNAYVSVSAVKHEQQYVTNKLHPEKGYSYLYFTNGSVESICLTTKHKQTLWLQSDVDARQPLSTGFCIKGSQGSWMNLSNSIYIRGKSLANHTYEADESYLQQYDHPQWNTYRDRYKNVPEGDCFALALQDFITGLQQHTGCNLPVYAAATNSIIGPLATISAQRGGIHIDFPDFSSGKM